MEYTMTYDLSENSPAKMIRTSVFIEEQGFQNEFDQQDHTSWHFVFYQNGEPFGCARIFKTSQKPNRITLGRVAILKEYRGLHLGIDMLSAIEKEVKKMNMQIIELSAQVRVQPFYEKAGFQAIGETYMDEHCPHIHMEKKLVF